MATSDGDRRRFDSARPPRPSFGWFEASLRDDGCHPLHGFRLLAMLRSHEPIATVIPAKRSARAGIAKIQRFQISGFRRASEPSGIACAKPCGAFRSKCREGRRGPRESWLFTSRRFLRDVFAVSVRSASSMRLATAPRSTYRALVEDTGKPFIPFRLRLGERNEYARANGLPAPLSFRKPLKNRKSLFFREMRCHTGAARVCER